MKKISQSPLVLFEPYIEALQHSYPHIATCRDQIFKHESACSGKGNSCFRIIEKSSNKAPKNICHICMDELIPDSGQGEKKCDGVFIVLEESQPSSDLQGQAKYFCFGELKKGSNFDKAYEQIVATIKAFKAAFEHRHLAKEIDMPKKKIWGVIGGGAPATGTNFQKQQADFKKHHGQDLLKSRNNGDVALG
jgi:hypothetical protein